MDERMNAFRSSEALLSVDARVEKRQVWLAWVGYTGATPACSHTNKHFPNPFMVALTLAG